MANINTTEVLAAAQAQAIELAAPTDQSLNAGALLPDEPVGDVLSNEVEAEAQVILDTLPKLDADPPTTESMFMELMYLHKDMYHSRGMNQSLATEAISLIPNFGKGAPIGAYSKHPSETRYQVSLEEVEQAVAADVVQNLQAKMAGLRTLQTMPGAGSFLGNMDFTRKADQTSMLYHGVKNLYTKSTAAGFHWDDPCFRGCAVDPSQNAMVPTVLQVPKRLPYEFATMGEYYQTYQIAVPALEMMTQFQREWTKAFESVLEAPQATQDDKSVLGAPRAPMIAYGSGKSCVIHSVGDVYRTAFDSVVSEFDDIETLSWVGQLANAGQEVKSHIEQIINRLKDYNAACQELADVIEKVSVLVDNSFEKATAANALLTEYSQVHTGLWQAHGEIVKWCMNANLTLSYAIALAGKVTEHAWISINQCKDTLQMPEEAYADLKATVDEIKIVPSVVSV